MKTDGISLGAVIVLAMVWGSSFALTTIALEGFAPVEIALGRIWLSVIVLVGVLTALRLPWPRDPVAWRYLSLTGLFSLVLPFFLLAWGQQHVPSNIAAIIISGTPLFILVLARALLAEPVGARKWTGFAIGFGGLALLVGPGALTQLGGASVWGQLACLGAALSYAASSIVIRKMPMQLHPVSATAAAQVVAAVLSLPMLALAWPLPVESGPPLLALAALGLIQTGAAQVLRYYTIRRAGPVFVSIVGYLIPIWAGFLGVMFLGETLTLQAILAYGLIILGLLVARPGRRS